MDSLKNQELIDRQATFWKNALKALMALKNVAGLTISGSFCNQTNSAYSDIDATCFLRVVNEEGLEEIDSCISGLGDLIGRWCVSGDFTTQVFHVRYAFNNSVLFDLVLQCGSGFPIHPLKLSRIEYDPEGMLKMKMSPGRAPVKPDVDLNTVFAQIRLAYGEILGATLAPAEEFRKLYDAQRWMNEIRDKIVAMRQYSRPLDHLREKQIRETFFSLDVAEMRIAARLLLNVFKDVFKEAYSEFMGPTVTRFGELEKVLNALDAVDGQIWDAGLATFKRTE